MANPWDFTDVWRTNCYDYPDFVGSPCPIPEILYDPIATSGCPQCGTFLWNEGIPIDSKATLSGRHRDKDKDEYVYCARCDFAVNLNRHQHAPRGSTLGWGTTFTEQTI